MSDREPRKVKYDKMQPYSNQCRYRECEREVEGPYCCDLHKRLEASAKRAEKKKLRSQ